MLLRGALRIGSRQSQWTHLFRSIHIQRQTTPNVDSLKFLTSIKVLENGGTQEFLDSSSAAKSPLAQELFSINGVVGVLYGPEFLTVSKDADVSWTSLEEEVTRRISEFFEAGKSIQEMAQNNVKEALPIIENEEDRKIVIMIQQLLEERIRPTIQEDGGDVEFRGYVNGIVRLRLKGSCRTCDSSIITLRNGIANMLQYYIPEVTGVEHDMDTEQLSMTENARKQREKAALATVFSI